MGFFQLILEVFSKLILNIANKNLRISKVFLKEGFKVRPCNKSDTLVIAFMLSPPKTNSAIEEKSTKRGIIYPNSSQSLKIIWMLLTKMIIVYMEFL